MGIELQQLTPGNYFKGYDQPAPNGRKCFFYITGAAMHANHTTITVTYEVILRHVPGAYWTGGKVFVGSIDEESLAKQGVLPNDVVKEGVPFAPTHIQRVNGPTATPVATPPPPVPNMVVPKGLTAKPPPNPLKQWLDAKGKQISEAEAKAQAKAERNKGKSVVPGNAHSETCLRCGAPNKPIPSIGMYWCSGCEIE